MSYRNFVSTVTSRFESLAAEIQATHNYELGVEFEVAVCQTLRAVLPQRFGVCRGYIEEPDGKVVGDDIVVYDRNAFPTLRLLEQDRFEQKEHVPAEAVCAYLEAKHTLYVTDKQGGQGLRKALEQVDAAKRVSREPAPLELGGPFTSPKNYKGMTIFEHNDLMPERSNPLYGGIICRQAVLEAKTKLAPTPQQFAAALQDQLEGLVSPDLIVGGNGPLALPVMVDTARNGLIFPSPFFVQEKSKLAFTHAEGDAIGLGAALLLHALQLIQLRGVSWSRVLTHVVQKLDFVVES